MLIDNAIIKISAGKGGPGAVAFSHVMMTLGPTGGSGGKGGSVYLEAVADLGALRRFRTQKSFAAEDGHDGRSAFRDGRDGTDLILLVPRGTVVHDRSREKEHELTTIGERLLIAEGGKGGRGNFQYKSSTNTSPKKSQPGLPGENALIELELKLIADIGLIGLPNIGKSSFLNEVTNSQSRVANYPFTTLEPHLGAYGILILADIPGLIEGASGGRGLGIRFLRHIERTSIIFHFISAESVDPKADYTLIRKELGAYNSLLLKKEEYIVVSKSDAVREDRVKEIIKKLKPLKKEIISISIYNPEEMVNARKLLDKISRSLHITKK